MSKFVIVKPQTKVDRNFQRRPRPKCTICKTQRSVLTCEATRCRKCCMKNPNPCEFHLKEREDELDILRGRYGLDDVLENQCGPKKKRKIEKGAFVEPLFTHIEDTVTLFCINDFFSNKSFHFDALKTSRRAQKSKSRRGRNNLSDKSTSLSLDQNQNHLPQPATKGKAFNDIIDCIYKAKKREHERFTLKTQHCQ